MQAMMVKVVPKKTENGAVYALEVSLTNKSKTDTAVLHYFSIPVEDDFSWTNLHAGEKFAYVDRQNGMLRDITKVKHFPPIDAGPQRQVVKKSLTPSESLVICLKLEDFVRSDQVPDPNGAYLSTVALLGWILEWRRASGQIQFSSDFENYVLAPQIELGKIRLAVDRKRGC